jgi:hypothetical protein
LSSIQLSSAPLNQITEHDDEMQSVPIIEGEIGEGHGERVFDDPPQMQRGDVPDESKKTKHREPSPIPAHSKLNLDAVMLKAMVPRKAGVARKPPSTPKLATTNKPTIPPYPSQDVAAKGPLTVPSVSRVAAAAAASSSIEHRSSPRKHAQVSYAEPSRRSKLRQGCIL